MKEKFSWGRVIQRFTYDFDGTTVEVVKYHPWVSDGCFVQAGAPDMKVTEYHCEELHESFFSIDAFLIAWVANKNLGPNQHTLAAGICRALGAK